MLNIPSGPPVGAAHVARRDRGVAAAAARHVPALRQRRDDVRRRGARARSRPGARPESHDRRRPSVRAVPDGELRPGGAAAARQRVRRARRRAPRRGSRHRRGDRSAHRASARPRRARQPGGHGAREGQLPPALRPGGRGAAERDAVLRAARRTAGSSTRAGCATRRRRAATRCCRSTWRWCSTSSPRCPRRRPSTRSSGRPRPPPSCTCAASTCPARTPLALAARIAERFRERLGVAARIELVPRDGLPRFAYKAARVVDA